MVSRTARYGSPFASVLVANGTQQSASFTVSKCISKRCLTCPKFVVNKTFISNLTKKSFFIINYSWENISCPTSNLIYVLTCSTCNIQYIVETALPLHKRINIYRSTKFCSEYMIKNFRNNCVAS